MPTHTVYQERLSDGRVVYMARCDQHTGILADGTSAMDAIYHLGMVHQMAEEHCRTHGLTPLACEGAAIIEWQPQQEWVRQVWHAG